MTISVAVVAILMAAAPYRMLCSGWLEDGECSDAAMRDPTIKCDCVARGIGSEQDREECLRKGSIRERAMERNIVGFRRKRSPLIAPLQLHRMRCVAPTPKGGNRLFQEIFCVPGTTFMKGCNRCMCRETGTSAYCTAKDCLMELRSLCFPAGSVKIFDCNTCICGPSRTWACSSFNCRPRLHYVECETNAAQFEDFETLIENCRPGTTFRRNCNVCYCSQNGTSAVCSTQPCTGVKGTLLPLQPVCGDKGGFNDNTQVQPHVEKDGIGGRVGGKGGGSGGRRRKWLALELVVDQLPCQPGDIVYEDNCFSCYCLVDGASILCLNIDCEPTDMDSTVSAPLQHYAIHRPKITDVPLVTKQVKCSSSAKVFSEGCNSCICVDADSGPVCTNWPCTDPGRTHSNTKRMKRSSQHCEPYTAYKKSCNICFCNMNGTNAVCTNLACHTGAQGAGEAARRVKRASISAEPAQCQPLTTYKKRCNTCFCDDEGMSATCTNFKCGADGLIDDPAGSRRWRGALPTTYGIHEVQRARVQEEGERRNLHEQKVPRSVSSSLSAG